MQNGMLAALALLSAVLVSPSARACSLTEFADDGRYVGGNLIEQIALKANKIQIVRASARHIVRRVYSEGTSYLRFGRPDAFNLQPEFLDEFAYELTVIETLKGDDDHALPDFIHPRVLAYGANEFLEFAHQVTPDSMTPAPYPTLPDWLYERPGDSHFMFSGASEESVGVGYWDSGDCQYPYYIDVGQTFVALRDAEGRLYPSSGALGLHIDSEFRLHNGRRDRAGFDMQSLIYLTGADDPFLVRLRRALEH